MAKDHKRLGDLLLEDKLITASDLQLAIEESFTFVLAFSQNEALRYIETFRAYYQRP